PVPESESSVPSLDTTVVRICPACGVVNPGGPSGGCPHLQLVRFDGVDDQLSDVLSRAAEARRMYADLADQLRRAVLESVREGRAEVETTRMAKAREIEDVVESFENGSLYLTHPDPPRRPRARPKPRPKRKRTGPPPVDPRQLELLAQSPPKGDA
ncbi:MAG: hypothetical protein JRF63_04825, partial [Deltaproteobacteria bacterium]|nr:hypothetical protein [Deltaproteobacteria bacterium]